MALLGMSAVAYFNASPLVAAASAADFTTPLDNITDVTQNLSTGEADITTRANSGWEATAATLKAGSVSFDMIWQSGDAGFAAIKNAWLNSNEIAAAFMSEAIAVVGSEGIASNFTVVKFERSEPLKGAITVSVELKPSSYTGWLVI